MRYVTNPVTGNFVGSVHEHTPEQVAEAVMRARIAQQAWQRRPFRERKRIVTRFHDLILDKRDDLIATLRAEAGKSRRDAFVEVFAVAGEARYYAYHGGKHLKPRRTRGAIPLRDYGEVHYRPYGVVGVISAWNFPFILTMGDTIPALLAGNAVVIKPSELTPLTAKWGRARFIEAGLPEHLLQIVNGPGDVAGRALVDNVDYVMFTGSTRVGHLIAQQAAKRLIPYSLELGGKNALLVLDDANIRHAAEVAVEGAFNNSGQVCINWERIYVHRAIYDAFVDEVTRQTENLRQGSGQEADVGALVSEPHFEKVKQMVDEAVEKGAHVLAGGQPRPDLGPTFYAPTLLADVTPDMPLHTEEVFGPVASIYRVNSAEDAIRLANDSPYGLHYGVHTGSRSRGKRIARYLQAGAISINDSYTYWGALDAPMGGIKQSGIGRRHGPKGIRKYTQPITVFTNRTSFQIGSGETALALNERLMDLLTMLLKVWRRIPFIR